jgi:Mrp family chromosome partitioning ATPase
MPMLRLRAPSTRDPGEFGFASLVLRQAGEESRLVTFIAARRQEGTSSVALEFARTAREIMGQRVLLLDATARTLLLDQAPLTLAEAVRDQLTPDRAILPGDDDVDRALLGDPNGSQRAGTDSAADPGELWRPLRERYALIVIDAPSLEESHLGLALARHSDATVVVVRAERTRRWRVRQLLELLRQTGAQLAGTVLNRRRTYAPRFLLGLR